MTHEIVNVPLIRGDYTLDMGLCYYILYGLPPDGHLAKILKHELSLIGEMKPTIKQEGWHYKDITDLLDFIIPPYMRLTDEWTGIVNTPRGICDYSEYLMTLAHRPILRYGFISDFRLVLMESTIFLLDIEHRLLLNTMAKFSERVSGLDIRVIK